MDGGATAEESPGPSAVQGVPWWGSVGQPQYIQPAHSSPATSSFFSETQTTIPAMSFLPPVLQQATAQALEGNDKEQSQPCASGLPPPTTATHYMLPSTQLEVGCSVGLASYPYTNAYLTGMVAAYGAQAMIQPHMLGIQQSRMPLPSDIIEEEPVYVNAKQYHGILRRRQSRAKADSENRLMKSRKPYLHESRHLHALRRARGCGGRFLNRKLEETNVARSSSKQMAEVEIDLKRQQLGASENNSLQTLNDSAPVNPQP